MKSLVTVRSAAGWLLATASIASFAATGADPDLRLSEAVKRGDAAAVKTLLQSHVSPSSAEGDGSTPLHWAVYNGNLALVKQLVDAHADVSAKTRLQGITPLMMACQNGDAAIIRLLLDHGADVNLANELGTTPLMFAATSGYADAVSLLLERGARVNDKEKSHGQTALMFAAAYNRADAIKILMAHGADANVRTIVVHVAKLTIGKNGQLIVTEPGQMDSKEVQESEARYLANSASVPKVAEKEADPAEEVKKRRRRDHGAISMGGMTAMLYAARQGNIAATEALIAGGADMNLPSGSEHTTPLTLAIANGHFDEAKVLIDHGANVNLPNDQGMAPLYAAIDVSYSPHEWSAEPISEQETLKLIPLLKLLLSHGANVNERTKISIWERTLSENRAWSYPGGSTPFYRAAQAADVDVMKTLIEAGADKDLTTLDGSTPLMAAAGLGWAPNYTNTTGHQLEAVKYCVSLGANPDARDSLGFSALHGAAIVGDNKVIQYLVDHGAKPDAKSKAGDYPADYANGPFEKSVPHPEVVAFLEKLGSPNSHNCRSSECVVPNKPEVSEAKPAEAAGAPKVAESKSKDESGEKKTSASGTAGAASSKTY